MNKVILPVLFIISGLLLAMLVTVVGQHQRWTKQSILDVEVAIIPGIASSLKPHWVDPPNKPTLDKLLEEFSVSIQNQPSPWNQIRFRKIGGYAYPEEAPSAGSTPAQMNMMVEDKPTVIEMDIPSAPHPLLALLSSLTLLLITIGFGWKLWQRQHPLPVSLTSTELTMAHALDNKGWVHKDIIALLEIEMLNTAVDVTHANYLWFDALRKNELTLAEAWTACLQPPVMMLNTDEPIIQIGALPKLKVKPAEYAFLLYYADYVNNNGPALERPNGDVSEKTADAKLGSRIAEFYGNLKGSHERTRSKYIEQGIGQAEFDPIISNYNAVIEKLFKNELAQQYMLKPSKKDSDKNNIYRMGENISVITN